MIKNEGAINNANRFQYALKASQTMRFPMIAYDQGCWRAIWLPLLLCGYLALYRCLLLALPRLLWVIAYDFACLSAADRPDRGRRRSKEKRRKVKTTRGHIPENKGAIQRDREREKEIIRADKLQDHSYCANRARLRPHTRRKLDGCKQQQETSIQSLWISECRTERETEPRERLKSLKKVRTFWPISHAIRCYGI